MLCDTLMSEYQIRGYARHRKRFEGANKGFYVLHVGNCHGSGTIGKTSILDLSANSRGVIVYRIL